MVFPTLNTNYDSGPLISKRTELKQKTLRMTDTTRNTGWQIRGRSEYPLTPVDNETATIRKRVLTWPTSHDQCGNGSIGTFYCLLQHEPFRSMLGEKIKSRREKGSTFSCRTP